MDSELKKFIYLSIEVAFPELPKRAFAALLGTITGEAYARIYEVES
jgi:hypothetical protein